MSENRMHSNGVVGCFAIIDSYEKLVSTLQDALEAPGDWEPTDEEIEGAYCLAEGHKHRNRYAEALCSLRFQLAAVKEELSDLRNEL